MDSKKNASVFDSFVFVPVYEWLFSNGLQGWAGISGRVSVEVVGEVMVAERLLEHQNGYIANNRATVQSTEAVRLLIRSPNVEFLTGRWIERFVDGPQRVSALPNVHILDDEFSEIVFTIEHFEGDKTNYRWIDIGERVGDIIEFKSIALGDYYSRTKSIIFNQSFLEMFGSSTKKIKATISPADAYQVLTWKSSDETIASVSQDGVVASHNKTGEITITATSIDGVRATAKVKVYDDNTLYQSPLVSSVSKADFRARELQFGDGYSQRAPDGINTDLRTYSLEFRGKADYIQEISEFFAKHKGVKAFKWKPQDRDNERLFICKGMKTVFITPEVRSLAVDIKEVLA